MGEGLHPHSVGLYVFPSKSEHVYYFDDILSVPHPWFNSRARHSAINAVLSYTIAIKLSIFVYDPDFRSNEKQF